MPRRTFTGSQQARWIARYESQDDSAAAFCRRHALPYTRFLAWLRDAGESSDPAPRFVEVELPANADHGPAAVPLAELLLGGDVVLRIYPPSGASARHRP
ncbi:MAG TPA: hypothetical protein VLE27_16500 [Thermoanaerobaculia bacterium]|nr:hypothetical protein [Thermoanaerobaculia bacterium]